MFATFITRRNPSSVTCATAALVSKPTSTAISRSTSMRTFLVSVWSIWDSVIYERSEAVRTEIQLLNRGLCDINGLNNEWLTLPIWKILKPFNAHRGIIDGTNFLSQWYLSVYIQVIQASQMCWHFYIWKDTLMKQGNTLGFHLVQIIPSAAVNCCDITNIQTTFLKFQGLPLFDHVCMLGRGKRQFIYKYSWKSDPMFCFLPYFIF